MVVVNGLGSRVWRAGRGRMYRGLGLGGLRRVLVERFSWFSGSCCAEVNSACTCLSGEVRGGGGGCEFAFIPVHCFFGLFGVCVFMCFFLVSGSARSGRRFSPFDG